VFTAAEAAAAAFGLSILGCLANEKCRNAVKKAIEQAVNGLGTTIKSILEAQCKLQHSLYKNTEKFCSSCETGRAGTFCERVVLCYRASTNGTCWSSVVAQRGAYLLSGCDFILENNFEGHVKALLEKIGALNNCAKSGINNCRFW